MFGQRADNCFVCTESNRVGSTFACVWRVRKGVFVAYRQLGLVVRFGSFFYLMLLLMFDFFSQLGSLQLKLPIYRTNYLELTTTPTFCIVMARTKAAAKKLLGKSRGKVVDPKMRAALLRKKRAKFPKVI